ncbi:MAG TPA: DnaB-like helicase C-terminal domain-containing protein [Galbitalea sp.]
MADDFRLRDSLLPKERELPTAELAVIGAAIVSNGTVLDDIALTGEDFNDARLGELFDVIRGMRERGLHIDAMTLSSANPNQAAFIWSLTDAAPSTHGFAVEAYAEIVAAHGMHRRMQGIAAGVQGFTAEMTPEQMIERLLGMVDDAQGERKAQVRMVRDILPGVVERMQSNATFTPTPWPSLNEMIGGLRPGCVYIVAARPGVGKTVIAGQIAAQLANHGLVAFSSLEMSEDELVSRLISERLSISVGKVKDNKMTTYDWEVFARDRSKLENLNIAIDDRPGVSATEVRAHAKAVSRLGALSGIVVDYMQLMTSTSKSDRYLQVDEFSRQLKTMAKAFHVPVIALSQLNRKVEDRLDRKPRLSDLRESGSIEQDADAVFLLRREENDGHTFENPNESLWIDIAKNRHGETGEVELSWQGRYSRAVEWT